MKYVYLLGVFAALIIAFSGCNVTVTTGNPPGNNPSSPSSSPSSNPSGGEPKWGVQT